MTNNTNVIALTSAELIALNTPEAQAEMRRRMERTRSLPHANSAKVRAYNAMAECLGLDPMVFVRKNGQELALAKHKPAMKSSKKASSSAKTSKKSSAKVAKTPSLEERVAKLESGMEEILSILHKMNK